MHKREQGYNLIEVLIATALLGVVVLSISTLFFMGRANMYSGKQTTAAVAVGTRVMEDFTTLSLEDTIAFFDLAGKTPGALTVAGKSYPNAILVKSQPLTTLSNTYGAAYLTRWVALLTAEKFSKPKLTLIFQPYKGLNNAAVADATTANVLKVRAIIEWNEAQRPRKIVLDTVKVDRSKS